MGYLFRLGQGVVSMPWGRGASRRKGGVKLLFSFDPTPGCTRMQVRILISEADEALKEPYSGTGRVRIKFKNDS